MEILSLRVIVPFVPFKLLYSIVSVITAKLVRASDTVVAPVPPLPIGKMLGAFTHLVNIAFPIKIPPKNLVNKCTRRFDIHEHYWKPCGQ